MTLPNKLTMLRIAAIPAMIAVASVSYLGTHTVGSTGISLANLINLIIFALASFTDFLDGKIARKYNLVTTFGKFADPLADKMLVLVSFIILLSQAYTVYPSKLSYNLGSNIEMWAVAIILIRELMVSGIRLVAAQKGEVIAAGWSGKVKTAVTMIVLIVCFLYQANKVVWWIGRVGIWVSVILTVYSGIVYLYNSRKLIFESI